MLRDGFRSASYCAKKGYLLSLQVLAQICMRNIYRSLLVLMANAIQKELARQI